MGDMEHFQFAAKQFGLGPFAAAQVANAINVRITVELLEMVGGEVVLEPGFADRSAERKMLVATRGLADGSYKVWLQAVTPEFDHAGLGTRWERAEGSEKKGLAVHLYEVEQEGGKVEQGGDGTVTLRRIDRDGTPVANTPLIRVKEDYLLRGVGGWSPWRPPGELIDDIGGKAF